MSFRTNRYPDYWVGISIRICANKTETGLPIIKLSNKQDLNDDQGSQSQQSRVQQVLPKTEQINLAKQFASITKLYTAKNTVFC